MDGLNGLNGMEGCNGDGRDRGLFTARDWLAIGCRLRLSPQQTLIARLIIEEDLSNIGLAHRLGHKSAKGVEKQLERMYAKLSRHPGAGNPGAGAGVRSRVGLVNAVWTYYVRMRMAKT